MSHMELPILRQAREPLTTKKIAALTLPERALNVGEVKYLTLMVRSVFSALMHQREKGTVVSVNRIGNYQPYKINSAFWIGSALVDGFPAQQAIGSVKCERQTGA